MAIEAVGGLTVGFMPSSGQPQNSATVHSPNSPAGEDPRTVKKQESAEFPRYVQKVANETKKPESAGQQDRVKEATEMLNDFMKHYAIELQFVIDDGQTIVKVKNKQTGDVIRQIPSEEVVRLSKALDTLQGLIIQKKV